MEAVPEQDWKLDAAVDDARRRLLLSPLPPENLIDQIAGEAAIEATRKSVCAYWKEASDRKGWWRLEAAVPLTAAVFDLFFNGRMGYRAQYYLSVGAGRSLNRYLVDRLIPVIKKASATSKWSFPVGWSHAERSLNGPHSKIWIVGDWAAFLHEPEAIKPDRWVNYWKNCKHKPLGLAAPLPDDPMLDLKGTFVCTETGEPWLPNSKRDRDEKIHLSGWT